MSIADYEARRRRAVQQVRARLAECLPVVPQKPAVNSRLVFGDVAVTCQRTKFDPVLGVDVPRAQPLFKLEVEGGVLFCTAEQFGRIIDAWIGMGFPS